MQVAEIRFDVKSRKARLYIIVTSFELFCALLGLHDREAQLGPVLRLVRDLRESDYVGPRTGRAHRCLLLLEF
jgi:hypothetical protein